MAVRVKGLSRLSKRLDNIGKLAPRKAQDALQDGAEMIAEIAAMMAPRKRGYLENAIKVDKDYKGFNKRRRWTIYVDEAMQGYKGLVGVYADEMHNTYYRPGKGSQEKQASSSYTVGPFFLDRAVKELWEDILESVIYETKKAVR